MAKQTRYYRKWKDSAFVAGGTETIDLPIGMDVESLHFYLSGSINVTTAYTGVRSEGLAQLIRRVDILLNGETIATIPGTMLTHGNFARHAGLIKINPLFALGNNPYVEVVGFLDFAHISGVRQKDSNLRTLGARQFQARITWGVMSDVFTGAGAATAALTLTTSIRETKEEHTAARPEVRRLHRFLERTYLASTVDRIPLDPNMLYRGLVLRAESAGDLSGAVLNNVRVQIGSDIIFDLPAAVMSDANTQDNGFSLPTGYYLVDFAPSPSGLARISDFLDLHGHADAFLILDAVGGATNKVQIVAHEFEWLHNAIAENEIVRQEEAGR